MNPARTPIEFSLSMLIREQWLYSGSGVSHYIGGGGGGGIKKVA